MFHGVLTALATPFDENLKIDWAQLEKNIEYQITSGVSGLVPVGTTGENPTLTDDETHELISRVVHWTNGRVPVIVGAGSNSTSAAVQKAEIARQMGADATMQVVPYYNKPTQEGIIEHFLAVADSVDCPVMLYNVPGRTAVRLEPESVLTLAKHERICALKDAGGDISETAVIVNSCPGNFSVLSGEDALTFPMLSLQIDGVVSVASNLFPEILVRMVSLADQGNWEASRQIHFDLLPLFDLLFSEPNPTPLKAAMAIRFGSSDACRLPLRRAGRELAKKLQEVIKEIEESML